MTSTACTTGTSCSVYVDFIASDTHFTPPHSPLGKSDVHHPAPEYPDPSFFMSSASGASMIERPKKKDSCSMYMNKKEYREMMERREKEIRQAFAALKGASKVQCFNLHHVHI